MLDLLWYKYWVATLSASPLISNREFAAGQVRVFCACACACACVWVWVWVWVRACELMCVCACSCMRLCVFYGE